MKQGFVKPGLVLGILGGGQLGRMFAMSAHAMGYQVAVLDPDENSPAGLICEYHIKADYEDETALDKLINLCDAVSTEFENVPSKVMEYLESKVQVHPSAKAVSIAQNRIKEKNFFSNNGVATTAFIAITSNSDLQKPNNLKFPCVMKTAQFGYDGKGQQICKDMAQAEEVFSNMQGDCVLEQMVDLVREVSVILTRSYNGEIAFFPVAENEHKNGILDLTLVPANINADIEKKIISLAEKIANGIDYVGVLAIEFFISKQGQVMVNEMAPRPHNSGHYTMNACVVSQFEQQVRAMAHLPLAKTDLISPTAMINLLGDSWQKAEPDWRSILGVEKVFLHLYGKKHARVGRKMGHINILAESKETVLEQVKCIRAKL